MSFIFRDICLTHCNHYRSVRCFPCSFCSIHTSEGTTTSSPTPTATLQSLRPDSKLAVTGWRADGGFKIRLFYQDRNNNIRFSDYSSDERNWSGSTKASAGGVTAGTPMGDGETLHMNHAKRPQHAKNIHGPVLRRCLPVDEITHIERVGDPPSHLITPRTI